MFGQVGTLEIVVVLIIALIVLGPKRLPEVARSLGKGVRELREAMTFDGKDDDEDDDDDDGHTLLRAPEREDDDDDGDALDDVPDEGPHGAVRSEPAHRG